MERDFKVCFVTSSLSAGVCLLYRRGSYGHHSNKKEPLAKTQMESAWKHVCLKRDLREDAPQPYSLLLFDDALMRSTSSSSSSSSRIQEPQPSLFPSVNEQCAPLRVTLPLLVGSCQRYWYVCIYSVCECVTTSYLSLIKMYWSPECLIMKC